MKTGVIFWLMVWNMNFIFPSIGNVIIPTDELHNFFRGVGQPPTSCRFSLEICQVPSHVYPVCCIRLGFTGNKK